VNLCPFVGVDCNVTDRPYSRQRADTDVNESDQPMHYWTSINGQLQQLRCILRSITTPLLVCDSRARTLFNLADIVFLSSFTVLLERLRGAEHTFS